MDLATLTKAQSHKAAKANQVKPQVNFGQEMPNLVNPTGIPISSSGSESRSSGPPILPPHLLQVILNKVSFLFVIFGSLLIFGSHQLEFFLIPLNLHISGSSLISQLLMF